jgi:GntR family phosphonate transport system transcriptional regulator
MDRVAGLALWRQIADQIKGDISKDILGPGCKLPTEILLAQQFKVNRHTIRRSIAELVEEGLLKVPRPCSTFNNPSSTNSAIERLIVCRFTLNCSASTISVGSLQPGPKISLLISPLIWSAICLHNANPATRSILYPQH